MKQISLLDDDSFAREKEECEIIRPSLEKILEDWNLPLEMLRTEELKNSLSIRLNDIVVFRVCLSKKAKYIDLPQRCKRYIFCLPYKSTGSKDNPFLRVPINSINEISDYYGVLCKSLELAISLIPKEFDCCQFYMECSNAKKCVNPHQKFAIGCGYKRVLKSGRIIYGINRNVD